MRVSLYQPPASIAHEQSSRIGRRRFREVAAAATSSRVPLSISAEQKGSSKGRDAICSHPLARGSRHRRLPGRDCSVYPEERFRLV